MLGRVVRSGMEQMKTDFDDYLHMCMATLCEVKTV